MKLAIIGSRSFVDYNRLCRELAPYKPKISEIISGGAKGADTLGERYALENGFKTQIFYIIINCDGVIAFWDMVSPGTKHSISLCDKYNKPYKIISI